MAAGGPRVVTFRGVALTPQRCAGRTVRERRHAYPLPIALRGLLEERRWSADRGSSSRARQSRSSPAEGPPGEGVTMKPSLPRSNRCATSSPSAASRPCPIRRRSRTSCSSSAARSSSTRSCRATRTSPAPCHLPQFGTTDGRTLPDGVHGIGLGPNRGGGVMIPRNSPALFDLHLKDELFWDGRLRRTEEAIQLPP